MLMSSVLFAKLRRSLDCDSLSDVFDDSCKASIRPYMYSIRCCHSPSVLQSACVKKHSTVVKLPGTAKGLPNEREESTIVCRVFCSGDVM